MSRFPRSLPVALAALIGLTIVVAAPRSQPSAIKAAPVASTGAWTTYHHDNARTGSDSTVPQATSVTAGWTSATVDGQIYGSPLVFNGVVYTATLNNTVYAINQATGVTMWSKNLGTPQATGWVCGNVAPMGILATPVIDTAANRIYAVAEIAGTTPIYHLFGLDLAASGNVVLDTVINPTGFDWKIQQQRGALALANGYVYIPFGGRAGDCFDGATPYYGWVVAAPTSGVGSPIVFQTPSSAESVWSAGGVVVDDTSTNVFIPTGNAIPCAGSTLSDAIVRVSPTLAGPTFFEPNDWQANWCGPDSDLGSASPVLISPTLMFMAGKRGGGFLLDPTNLGGVDGQLYPTPKPAVYAQADVCFGNTSNATFGSFAYAAPYVYIECEGRGLVALNTNTSARSFTPCGSTCGAPNWTAGPGITFGPPIVAGGAVWAATNGGGLYAFNAATGAQLFHSANFGINRFVTPAEAGGQVFVPSNTVIRSFVMNSACTGTPLFTTYLNWYDKASAGMVSDTIHILNPGASPSSGCVTVSGYPGVSWSAPAGLETYVTMPAGTIGGPVLITVNSGPAVKASQRIQYNQSFNEVWAASAAQAATSSFLNWYDKASVGMLNDNIHLLNPGSTSATVTVSLPGAVSQVATVAAGAETYVIFPSGTIGGPVTVSSTQPVLASQRVQYNQTFNEVWAASATLAATTSYINWYDKASAGMFNDNIHLLNPGGTTASVTVSLPGATPQTVSVAAGAETYVNFPGQIGGPITVSSTQPVLASQRVQYNQSFNEVWSASAAQAAATSYFNWYDKASVGMFNDNIHVLNPGATSATVTVSLPGVSAQVITVAPGGEGYVNFAGILGGPVTVSATQPVLASQRVQYYQTFNEIWSG